MLISKEKLEDIKFRNNVIVLIKKAIRHSLMDKAKELGEISKEIKNRIEKGDYIERERQRRLVDKIIKHD